MLFKDVVSAGRFMSISDEDLEMYVRILK